MPKTNPADKLYHYKIHSVEVVDGDTFRCMVDLGMKTHRAQIEVRLADVDAYETRRISRARKQAKADGKTLDEIIKLGQEAEMLALDFFNVAEGPFILNTIEEDNFGRWLGTVYNAAGVTLATRLRRHKLASSLVQPKPPQEG